MCVVCSKYQRLTCAHCGFAGRWLVAVFVDCLSKRRKPQKLGDVSKCKQWIAQRSHTAIYGKCADSDQFARLPHFFCFLHHYWNKIKFWSPGPPLHGPDGVRMCLSGSANDCWCQRVPHTLSKCLSAIVNRGCSIVNAATKRSYWTWNQSVSWRIRSLDIRCNPQFAMSSTIVDNFVKFDCFWSCCDCTNLQPPRSNFCRNTSRILVSKFLKRVLCSFS